MIAKLIVTPLSRQLTARMQVTARRVQSAKLRATRTSSPFSGIVRLAVTALSIWLFAPCSLLPAQEVGDYILPEKTSSTGRVTNRYLPKGTSVLWGNNASQLPAKIAIGSGLSLGGSPLTLTASGGGEGGAVVIDDLTDVTITSAASGQILRYNGTAWVNYTHGFATLASPTFTGTVTIPSGASISGYLTTASAASSYQPLDAELTALAALTSAADRLPYFTGSGAASVTTFTSAARSLLDDTSAAAMRITLGLSQYSTDLIGFSDGSTFGAGFLSVIGTVSATSLDGNGSLITDLTATQITSGTLPDARLSGNVSLLGSSISLTSEVTGALPVANGGTGQTTASAARLALLPSITGNAGKFLRVNGAASDYELASISGGGDALTSGTLGQFAATTSAQLRGVLSDESGTGEFLTTTGSAADLSSFPTLNQNTTGNAATATALQTGREINGVIFDGTGNITVAVDALNLLGDTLSSSITTSSLTQVGIISTGGWQATPVADAYISSAATWNAKESALTFSTGLTRSTNTVTVNTSQNIATLSNLTSNGLVTTSGGTGALSVDTTTKARADAFEIGLAISDETTSITTGTAKLTFRMPRAMTLTAVRLSLTTASSSGLPTVDINEAGSTILSTKLTCDASEKTSTTAATAAVISDSSLADDAEITIDIDTAGTGATGAKVWLIGTR